ncbi:unnamed protein product [Pelagomonas calceolata]|uniref:Uncharacterized protein n=2 Tax=Pelagomonas calceolata TaxID=35677 RepID=A0A8J2S990_9STRA|nr:unnamed protein product [Pelagomonas calceolata]
MLAAGRPTMLLARRTALTATRAGRRTLSTAQQTTTERYPVLWQAAALYCGGGLAVSAYQLLNADCREAIEKAHTDAWGARRRLEGFDEVLEWLEWSEAGVGCDVAPKLVRQGALAAAVDGLLSDDLDVRCAAAATLAGLTRDDELARRCCSTDDARAALVEALERCEVKARTPRLDVDLGNAQIADAEAWADARAHEATLLLVAANLAPSWPANDRAQLAKVLVAVLDATRRRSAGLDKAREQYLDQADAQPRVAKLAVALHDSALREALREVEAAGALLAHALAAATDAEERLLDIVRANAPDAVAHVKRVDLAGGGRGEARLPELMAALAWSEDAEAALHANFAAHLLHASDDLPEPDLGVASGLDARQADLLHRCLDALEPEPLLLASGWGVARRWYRHATSPYAFFPAAHQRSLRPLPQALVRSALSTALGAALLTSLYGARGCRYELRRGYLAESDAHQVAFSAALVSLDLAVVLATLRRAPFAAFPFVVWNVLS